VTRVSLAQDKSIIGMTRASECKANQLQIQLSVIMPEFNKRSFQGTTLTKEVTVLFLCSKTPSYVLSYNI